MLKHFNITFVILIIIITIHSAFSFTKDEVFININKKQKQPNFAYRTDIISKTHIQGQTVKDSGLLIYSPPDCFKITMYLSKTEVSTIGDTTWTTMPNGNVTRSIGDNGMSALGNMNQTNSAPDIGDIIKKSDFEIIQEVPGKHVVIEFTMQGLRGSQKAQATYDTKEWLLRNMKTIGGPAGTVEIGYQYKKINGFNMMSKINMVMGAMGFMKLSYPNYRKIKKISKKEFKKF